MAKEYLNLLAKREYKVVLGPRFVNLWLLVIVLVATFISISFSNGSMRYLSDKMNDPFTNWLNIEKAYEEDDFDGLSIALEDSILREQYKIADKQGDTYYPFNFISADGKLHYLECRFFQNLNTPLVNSILDDDNLINNCSISKDKLVNNSLGVVITKDVLYKLGYTTENIPAYINFSSNSWKADSLGIKLYEERYAAAPIPLLAVVRRLPMNMDIIGTQYFYEQYNSNSHPLNLNSPDYIRQMLYFVEGEKNKVDVFVHEIKDLLADSHLSNDINIYSEKQEIDEELLFLKSWKEGHFIKIYDLTISQCINLDKIIRNKFNNKGVTRLYKYTIKDNPIAERKYLSVNFASLDSIRAFENYAKNEFKVQVDMTQVASKENFNAVSVMANILSWAMIVFALICIIMFVVNMLQSYFQKVKRNMGTFKAFGINSSELINVYVLILLAMIFSAVCVALGITWLIELLLPLFGLLKDGEFNYLYLWNSKTMWAIVVIVVATIATVHIVMTRLLRQTPGDLIYDR